MGIRHNNNLIYPTGSFTLTVFSEELKYAIECSNVKVIKIHKALKFDSEIVFDKFVSKIYTMRKTTTVSAAS